MPRETNIELRENNREFRIITYDDIIGFRESLQKVVKGLDCIFSEYKIGGGCNSYVLKGVLKQPEEHDSQVAIKVPICDLNVFNVNSKIRAQKLTETNKHLLAQFIQEAKTLQVLDGAGGAPRLIGFVEENPCAIVMELCPGVNLSHYAQNNPKQKCMFVLTKVEELLKEIHSAGYSHGDIYADNVLVHEEKNNIKMHLVDVGRATQLTQENKTKLIERDFQLLEKLKSYYRMTTIE